MDDAVRGDGHCGGGGDDARIFRNQLRHFCGASRGRRVGGPLRQLRSDDALFDLIHGGGPFIFRLKGNKYLESAMRGVRPASLGMLAAAAVTLGLTTFLPEGRIAWNFVAIALITGVILIKGRLSIPKTILIAAVLGLILG